MNAMKILLNTLLALAGWYALPASASAMCPLEHLTHLPAAHLQCHFYQGTEAFRKEDFSAAAASWKKVIVVRPVPADSVDMELFTSAYNNLGYLYFNGKGVKVNQKGAISYWRYSARKGNEEAAYHLCHVYGATQNASYRPDRARGYCNSALLAYEAIESTEASHQQILAELRKYVATLGPGKDSGPILQRPGQK